MKRIAGALILGTIFAGSVAMADPHFGHDHGRVDQSQHRDWQQQGHSNRGDERRGDRRDLDRGRFEHYQDNRDDRRWRQPEWNRERFRGVDYGYPRATYLHSWRRGERLPGAYYARPYVIADYRGCGLYAPPSGYGWVRVNGDAVLAAIATGIVLDVVYNTF